MFERTLCISICIVRFLNHGLLKEYLCNIIFDSSIYIDLSVLSLSQLVKEFENKLYS